MYSVNTANHPPQAGLTIFLKYYYVLLFKLNDQILNLYKHVLYYGKVMVSEGNISKIKSMVLNCYCNMSMLPENY